jgi:hypothetical protein
VKRGIQTTLFNATMPATIIANAMIMSARLQIVLIVQPGDRNESAFSKGAVVPSHEHCARCLLSAVESDMVELRYRRSETLAYAVNVPIATYEFERDHRPTS